MTEGGDRFGWSRKVVRACWKGKEDKEDGGGRRGCWWRGMEIVSGGGARGGGSVSKTGMQSNVGLALWRYG